MDSPPGQAPKVVHLTSLAKRRRHEYDTGGICPLKVLLAVTLGSLGLSLAIAPAMEAPASRLSLAFDAADWEASFLFHDSRALSSHPTAGAPLFSAFLLTHCCSDKATFLAPLASLF